MSPTRNKLVALSVAIALAASAGSAPVAHATSTPQIQTACKKAKIGGQRKCIAAGQFCARRYEKDYNKYGYTCSKRDKNGRYHLKKR